MRTMKQLAQEALDVQDACNLSGVVLSFGRAIGELRENNPSMGTDWINSHPICCLWSDKIAHLTGTQSYGHEKVIDAYRIVGDLAKGA